MLLLRLDLSDNCLVFSVLKVIYVFNNTKNSDRCHIELAHLSDVLSLCVFWSL